MTNSSTSKTNNTTNSLRKWCEKQLTEQRGTTIRDFHALSGDASFRKYYRIQSDAGSFIAVFAPPATEKNSEFVAIADLLADAGLRVPRIIAANLEQGFLLQTDLGDTLLLSELTAHSADHWYGRAIDALITLQQIDRNACPNVYTREQMRIDLERFPEWYVEGLLKHSMGQSEIAVFEEFCARLLNEAMDQPQVLTHYDYQSRNLMVCGDGELGIIDFQDALLAPVSYDLVSVLRDCYIKWPLDKVHAWLEDYRLKAQAAGIIDVSVDQASLLRWFDFMSLQRHVRVLGTFARLYLRDGKPGYLGDIPLVCEYVSEVAQDYEDLADFHGWFEQSLMPAVEQHDWYHKRDQQHG